MNSGIDRCSLSSANATRVAFPTWSISPNRARASDSVIHPVSSSAKAPSDADNASSSTALSLRASGGVDVPRPNAALIVFHIPITERYIAALHGTTAALLGALELEALRHQVTISPRQRPGRHSFHPQTGSCGSASTGFGRSSTRAWSNDNARASGSVERPWMGRPAARSGRAGITGLHGSACRSQDRLRQNLTQVGARNSDWGFLF